MAATYARIQGFKKDGSPLNQEATRRGTGAVSARASTWRTFARAFVHADGSGYIEVVRDDVVLHTFEFGKEETNVN